MNDLCLYLFYRDIRKNNSSTIIINCPCQLSRHLARKFLRLSFSFHFFFNETHTSSNKSFKMQYEFNDSGIGFSVEPLVTEISHDWILDWNCLFRSENILFCCEQKRSIFSFCQKRLRTSTKFSDSRKDNRMNWWKTKCWSHWPIQIFKIKYSLPEKKNVTCSSMTQNCSHFLRMSLIRYAHEG